MSRKKPSLVGWCRVPRDRDEAHRNGRGGAPAEGQGPGGPLPDRSGFGTTPRLIVKGWLMAGILTCATAKAQDAVPDLTLNEAVADITRAVADVVKAQHARELNVGLFNDNADPNHAFGPGLRKLLIDQLRAEGFNPDAKDADIRLFGSYAIGQAEIEGTIKSFPVAKVAFKLQRRNGKGLLDSEKDLPLDRQPRVTNADDLARMSGQTGFTPPQATAAERFKAFFESEKGDPNVFAVKGTQIRPRNGQEIAPYAVEMLAARFTGDQKPDPKGAPSSRGRDPRRPPVSTGQARRGAGVTDHQRRRSRGRRHDHHRRPQPLRLPSKQERQKPVHHHPGPLGRRHPGLVP